MASTYDISPTTQGTSFQNKAGRLHTLEIEVDFANDFTAGVAQNETVTIWDLPASCCILSAKIHVVTGQSTITDVDLGYSTDGSTNAGLLDGVSLATSDTDLFTAGLSAPIWLVAENKLVLTNKDAQTCNSAVIRVLVTLIDETVE